MIHFGPVLTLILTVLWIAAITNAINLIDGLDGLVGGVSIISLMTMGFGDIFNDYNQRLVQQGLAYEGKLYREVVENPPYPM